MNPSGVHHCRRCGTCCLKGGPALHRADRGLVQRGTIPAAALVTIRKGELAWDPIRHALLPLEDEIIKIKGRKAAAACRFLAPQDRRCEIYADRPVECRALTCWDTHDIEALYRRDRLTRRDLLGDVQNWWELIRIHEDRCAFARLAKWVRARYAGERHESAGRLSEIIQFDLRMRNTALEAGVDPELLDFLFGRPLAEVFESQFGIRIHGPTGKGNKTL